jgi:UDP-N-acetylglucosamine 2-epimerase (non-hydrolysing)
MSAASGRIKVMVIVGSRPEAIKMAPVIFALREEPERFTCCLCSTGQQRDMIPQALSEFDLQPDLDLHVMQPDQTLANLTARLVSRVDDALNRLQPDWVLVQGDTTSAMAAALVSFYRKTAIGHVEAGMRTSDQFSPFPEEINRRIITQCASAHFAPTRQCESNLLREGVPASRVFVTGNTVVDALLWTRAKRGRGPSRLPAGVEEQLAGRRLVFVTTHRRENCGAPLDRICRGLIALCELVDDIVIVLPVHPNPTVRKTVVETLGHHERIVLIDPQPYGAGVDLMDRAVLILTDSGGIQEEAPTFGKPVLVMRDTTERPEGIEAGVSMLVGTNQDVIVNAAVKLLSDPVAYERMSRAKNPYGDGAAASRIAAALRAGDFVSPGRPSAGDAAHAAASEQRPSLLTWAAPL